jgi:hypothetical protein
MLASQLPFKAHSDHKFNTNNSVFCILYLMCTEYDYYSK